MKTTHRDYAEQAGDFLLVCRFISANSAAPRAYTTWCLGRFVDWKYGLYPSKLAVPGFCESNAHLWFDGLDRLAGLVISESGGPDFAVLTSPGYRFMFEEILMWAREHWGGRAGTPEIEVSEHQTLEARALERQGFQLTSTFWTRRFDLTQELAPRLPPEPGFTIVDMATHPDYRAQRLLRDDAFSGKTDLSEAELQHNLLFYEHTHTGPIYHAACDLCVMAPDGRLVAGCEALIDAHNAEADIERVCTHSAFRRRGFARAVIQGCLYRLRDMGFVRAYITGYSPEAIALYGSLGATAETRSFVYELPTP